MRIADLKPGWDVVTNDGHRLGGIREVGQRFVEVSGGFFSSALYVPASAIANVEHERVHLRFDWPHRSVTIFGKGESRHAYVAVDDVADALVHWSLVDDPPRVVEFGGPEALTRMQAADAFERALGEPIKRRHVPRVALRIGSTILRPVKPALASVMGQALAADRADSPVDDEPLRSIGLSPRPASLYIEEVVRASRQA